MADARLNWHIKPGAEISRMQKIVDNACIRYMYPLTPWKTGEMCRSVKAGTRIGSGHLVYASPYARRQYYEHKSRKKWFETMKSRHLNDIKKEAEAR